MRAAIQEDVRAIGISSYNGGHVEFFARWSIFCEKKARTISRFLAAAAGLLPTPRPQRWRKGVDEIFFAGTSLDDMVKFVLGAYGKP